VEGAVKPVNIAKEMAARILSAEATEEHNQASRPPAERTEDRGEEQARRARRRRAQAVRNAPDQAQAPTEGRDDRRESRAGRTAPTPEDQTLVELRQALREPRS
jgi:hypothetical protein